MPTVSQAEEWAERYRRAWVGADAAAAASLFSENGSYRSNIFELPHQGRAGVATYWSEVTSTQGDVDVRMGSPTVDGERAHIEFWTTMTVDGAPMTLAGILLLGFDEDGLCTELREYWNFGEGTHQPPTGWGE